MTDQFPILSPLDLSGTDTSTLATTVEATQTVADAGSSSALDWSLYADFDLTLSQPCTISFTNVPDVAGTSASIAVLLRGAYATTWPVSVTWQNGVAPTGATWQVAVIWTTDGGTTFGGSVINSVAFATPSIALGTSAAAGSATTVIRSDSTIAAFDGTTPAAIVPGAPAVVGSNAFAPHSDHDHALDPTILLPHSHIVGEPYTGDGSTLAWTLANEADTDSVAAFVAGAWTDVTMDATGNVATFGSAPGNGAAIRFDYVPALS